VVVPPTSQLTGKLIQEMYGGDLQMILHDHRCSEEGHRHD
jgi:zinc transport system ATP-binding protein